MAQNQIINLGSTQAPYWEYTKTLAPNEHFKLNYVTDSFHLLDVSAPDALKVNFGGSMIQTPFTAGLGYKLTEPVEFIELWNDSAASLTVHFAVGIGDIRDNRLTVSGIVLTQNRGFAHVDAGTRTATSSFVVSNGQLSLLVTAGSVTVNCSSDHVNITALELPTGATWTVDIEDSATISVTVPSGSKFNYMKSWY